MLNIYHYREVVEYANDEPTPYAGKVVTIYQTGTSTPAAIYSDPDLVTPIANSEITTSPDGEVVFWSSLATVDLVRRRGGARTVLNGDLGASDELRYTRSMYLR